ncbi:hypothetical protein MFLAVUS_011032 [Mucor flavus]|uniref:Uncharacterized protein n=1 Tax=Mucor flavus TaxID=439312 RepID=A0ABP9ZEG1_9FUNG
MLIDQVNDDALMLERNGLLKNNTESELETVIKESTSDLPLGKALNLLLNIHSRVFDKAIGTIRESTQAELTVQAIESPTIRALISIENYLTSSDNFTISFDHVYRSLEEKQISTVSRQCESLVQQYILQELNGVNKRSQLAAVVLLQFLFTNYISMQDVYSDLSALFISPLTQISQNDSPTLLACSACDLALQFSRYIALHLNNTKDTIVPITELRDDNNNSKFHQISKAWEYTDALLYIMEKWHKSMGELELASFKELHSFLSFAVNSVQDKNQRAESVAAWNLIVTYLSPKSIVSEKPLTLKKQKFLLSGQTTTSLSTVKVSLFIILQKGNFVGLYVPDRASAIFSDEEEEIKILFKKEYTNMVQSFPIKKLGFHLVPLLVEKLPLLCTTDDIDSNELVQLIMDKVAYNKKTMHWLIPLLIRKPEISACNLLLNVLEQNNKSQPSYDLLSDLIVQNSSDFIELLENNLLSVLKNSNQACELLIQCMEYTHLQSLIQKLMSMTVVENQREKMTYIALISKTLLHPSWAGYSILVYIDLIRYIKLHKAFEVPVKPDFTMLSKLAPNTIVDYKRSHASEKKYKDEDHKLNLLIRRIEGDMPYFNGSNSTLEYKGNYQFVDNNLLVSALRQLVYKSNSLPGEAICIDSWRHLSFAFIHNHELIWSVIQPCVDIMNSYSAAGELNEFALLKKITPMLILQTIPEESFDIVKLPKSYVDLLSERIKTIDIEPQNIKLCNTQGKHTPLCIKLMDALLSRSLEDNNDGGIKSPVEFYIALLSKIFCK